MASLLHPRAAVPMVMCPEHCRHDQRQCKSSPTITKSGTLLLTAAVADDDDELWLLLLLL